MASHLCIRLLVYHRHERAASGQLAHLSAGLPGAPPIKSRVKSNAVFAEWMSHWTILHSFAYVPPGYFLLQYEVGLEKYGKTMRTLYSTVVWDADRRPVPLEVDKHWLLVGVNDDGRLVFGHREIQADTLRVVLTIGRIEP